MGGSSDDLMSYCCLLWERDVERVFGLCRVGPGCTISINSQFSFLVHCHQVRLNFIRTQVVGCPVWRFCSCASGNYGSCSSLEWKVSCFFQGVSRYCFYTTRNDILGIISLRWRDKIPLGVLTFKIYTITCIYMVVRYSPLTCKFW